MTVCIIGLGYIGLPTAAMFATNGYRIVGVDVNIGVVEALNKGEVIIKEPYLDDLVRAAVTSGNLTAQLEPTEADAFIICVPTPLDSDNKADMSYVKSAAESIVPFLRKGNVVILESTSPVGTTRNLLCSILRNSSLDIEKDLYVAYSPERVLPGQILMELVNNNRIIGGINQKSSEIARDLYRAFVKGEIFLTESDIAEMCKLMENTYRDVNIALANELAKICEKSGINAWKVIELCNKHPRVNIHQPGPGVGGHCIAVDPWFIIERVPETANLINLARSINDSMPWYLIEKIESNLKKVCGKKVTILGITYKPDVDDIRESPVIKLIELLEEKSEYEICIYDPYVKEYRYLCSSVEEAMLNSDLLVLGVHHSEFRKLSFGNLFDNMKNKTVLDTRSFFDSKELESIGVKHVLLGEDIE